MSTDDELLSRLQALWNEPSAAQTEEADIFAVGNSFADVWGSPSDWFADTVRPEPPWCPRYLHPRGWRSIYGTHLICATCHPPVCEEVVAEWINAGSDT